MVDLRWDGDNFRNEQSSSGTTADKISHSGKLQQGYQHGSLTQGLVAYYPMEKGQGETLHDSALKNLGQIGGTSWTSSSNIGNNCLSFDGSNDYIATMFRRLGDYLDKEFTASVWLKTTEGSEQRFFGKGPESDGKTTQLQLNIGGFEGSNGDYQFFMRDEGRNDLSITAPATLDGNWHHIVFIKKSDNASEMEIIEDGNKLSKTINRDQSFTNPDTLGSNPEIGRIWAGTEYSYYTGDMEDLRIYDRALSQPEIRALYNLSKPSGTQVTEKQVPSQDQGGISRYKFNGDATDSWGNNDGTDNTSVSPSYVTGVYGQAKNFDGANSDIVESSLIGFESELTLSFWAETKWDEGTGNEVLIDYEGRHFGIHYNNNDNDGGYELLIGNNSVATKVKDTKRWVHFVGTFDSSTAEVYINGKVANVESVSHSIPSSGSFYMGAAPEEGKYSSLAIDDVRVYKTALTPRQIEKLYHKGAYRIPRESTLQ